MVTKPWARRSRYGESPEDYERRNLLTDFFVKLTVLCALGAMFVASWACWAISGPAYALIPVSVALIVAMIIALICAFASATD